MVWDNKKTVILNALNGVKGKTPPNLQWIKAGIEGAKALNDLGITATVSRKFFNELGEYANELQLKPIE